MLFIKHRPDQTLFMLWKPVVALFGSKYIVYKILNYLAYEIKQIARWEKYTEIMCEFVDEYRGQVGLPTIDINHEQFSPQEISYVLHRICSSYEYSYIDCKSHDKDAQYDIPAEIIYEDLKIVIFVCENYAPHVDQNSVIHHFNHIINSMINDYVKYFNTYHIKKKLYDTINDHFTEQEKLTAKFHSNYMADREAYEKLL